MTSECEIQREVEERRARVLSYLMDKTVPSLREIASREGMSDRSTRALIKRVEKDCGVVYRGWGLRYEPALSDETYRLRVKLGDHLHRLREELGSSRKVAVLVGLNTREQIRATTRPFSHDWTLSQIERLAQGLGLSVSGLG